MRTGGVTVGAGTTAVELGLGSGAGAGCAVAGRGAVSASRMLCSALPTRGLGAGAGAGAVAVGEALFEVEPGTVPAASCARAGAPAISSEMAMAAKARVKALPPRRNDPPTTSHFTPAVNPGAAPDRISCRLPLHFG